MNLSRRSELKELLDRDDIPFPDIRRNMQELDFINTWLGGHAISIQGLKTLLDNRMIRPRTPGAPENPVRICEIGCGGGDNLRVLYRWCLSKGIAATIIGIDLNPHCIAVAEEQWKSQEELKDAGARWICSDYRQVSFNVSSGNGVAEGTGEGTEATVEVSGEMDIRPDIVFSSLFCHHFSDDDLVAMLQWMDRHSSMGWFINDLHRHRMAWLSIRLLTALFSKSYLVKNDAPLSVLRGFRRNEWEQIFRKAGIGSYSLRWKWAFRWLATRSKSFST